MLLAPKTVGEEQKQPFCSQAQIDETNSKRIMALNDICHRSMILVTLSFIFSQRFRVKKPSHVIL